MATLNILDDPLDAGAIDHNLLNFNRNGCVLQGANEGDSAFEMIAVPRCSWAR